MMETSQVFLIGGGWSADAYPHTYGPFVTAASANGSTRIACILLDDPERDDHFGMVQFAFNAAGTTDVYPVFVSPERPLRKSDIEEATGMFVAGGLTPAYHDAIVPSSAGWISEMVRNGLPYAGNSAGAMIAPTRGVIGGWRLTRDGNPLEICSHDVSENIDELDIREGLGLVPFAVDPHAAQYGTPTRLLHAVDSGLVSEAWAIDEDTVLIVRNGTVTVAGHGATWHIENIEGRLSIHICYGKQGWADASNGPSMA